MIVQDARSRDSEVLFQETQRYGRWWFALAVFAIAAGAWLLFASVQTAGRTTGAELGAALLVLAVGIGAPAWFLTRHLDVTVTRDDVRIRFAPFAERRIAGTDIATAQARRYAPVLEDGGWGMRGRARGNAAYTVHGRIGVDLRLHDGRRVLVGSQRAEKLAAAIALTIGAARTPTSVPDAPGR